MIFGFVKKLIKYYVDKLVHWMRIKKFNLELDNEIKKYFKKLDEEDKRLEIVEKGNFGEDGWSISIGDVEDGNTKD